MEKDGPIYIAKKQDQIDRALANFLNTYPKRDKLNILFVRESEGIYKFGQRRVFMKLGKNEQLGVQVGGGFVTISNFIEKYTHKEVEKIRRDENDEKRLSTSPTPRLRSPNLSPRISNISEANTKNRMLTPKVVSPRPKLPANASPTRQALPVNKRNS